MDKKDQIIDIHTKTISEHRAEIDTLKEDNVSLVGETRHLESEGVKKDLQIKILRSERKNMELFAISKKRNEKLEYHMKNEKPA